MCCLHLDTRTCIAAPVASPLSYIFVMTELDTRAIKKSSQGCKTCIVVCRMHVEETQDEVILSTNDRIKDLYHLASLAIKFLRPDISMQFREFST